MPKLVSGLLVSASVAVTVGAPDGAGRGLVGDGRCAGSRTGAFVGSPVGDRMGLEVAVFDGSSVAAIGAVVGSCVDATVIDHPLDGVADGDSVGFVVLGAEVSETASVVVSSKDEDIEGAAVPGAGGDATGDDSLGVRQTGFGAVGDVAGAARGSENHKKLAP